MKGNTPAIMVLLALASLSAAPKCDARRISQTPTEPFSEDSLRLSDVPDTAQPAGASEFWIPLGSRDPNVEERGGSLTFLWTNGSLSNPLFNAEMNVALFEGEPGNIRELHWHPHASEWALVLSGTCFTTMLDTFGKVTNSELRYGDVWYFPRNWPHAIQAGVDGCRAILAFSSPEWIPTNDFGISQLVTRFPTPQVAANIGEDLAATAEVQANLEDLIGGPGPLLLSTSDAPTETWPVQAISQSSFDPTWCFLSNTPKLRYGDSFLQQLTQATFTFATDLSGEWDHIAPGEVRAIHWHTNAGELQYLVTGILDVTVVSFGGESQQFTLSDGDLGWAPKGFAHSYQCVSADPCDLLLVWNTGNIGTIEMGAWMRNSPAEVVASNLDITTAQLSRFAPGAVFSPDAATAV